MNRQRLNIDVIARELPALRGWLLMDKPEKGLGSRAVYYRTLTDITNHWAVTLGDYLTDEIGGYVQVRRAS